MSVGRLMHLLETGQYHNCMQEALFLLDAGGGTAADHARICAALCRCRLELGDWQEAERAGELALSSAEDGADADLLASILVDLGTTRMRMRRYAEALAMWQRFCRLLPQMTGAQCQEGTVRQQMAEALHRMGRSEEALRVYAAARRWFGRFGDQASGWNCLRAMIDICLEQGELWRAKPLLEEGDRRLVDVGRRDQVGQLLDGARYFLASGRPDLAAQRAFAGLERAVDLDQQGRAQMLLCQTALDRECPAEALAFALAARVSAMEGHLYGLEFEAAEMIIRLLRTHGSPLMDEVAADFSRQGVDIYDYLSEIAVRRCLT